MRILRLTQRLPPFPGGLEAHVRELSLAQAARGARVEVLFAEGDPLSSDRVDSYRLAPVGEAHPLSRRWSAQQRYAWTASRIGKCAFGTPHVVHAHGDYAAAAAAVRLGARFGCPAVLTIHGGLSERPWHRALAATVFPKLAHVIAVSEDVAGQLQQRGVPRRRISVISSGVHRERFRPLPAERRAALRARFQVADDAVLALAVGRLHPVKGYQYLVQAMRELEGGGGPVRMVLVGSGPEEPALRRAAAGLRSVAFAGHLPPAEVADLLRAADLFVHPAIELGAQREGTPTSVLEALAAGLPVIASRTGGLPALIRNGENGLLVAPEDAAALAHALRRLAADPALRSAQGTRNRSHPTCRDWSEVADYLLELYRTLLSPGALPAVSVSSEAAW